MISHDRLKYLLLYDPDTGIFTWLNRTSNRIKIGDQAGYIVNNDYITIRIDGRLYAAHCLAWFYMYGYWCEIDIDHIDTIKTNNRWLNLRKSTRSQNLGNSNKKNTNTSGIKGVSWAKNRNKWIASITINYKTKNLGYYNTIEEAAEAYKKAAKTAFKEYART